MNSVKMTNFGHNEIVSELKDIVGMCDRVILLMPFSTRLSVLNVTQKIRCGIVRILRLMGET